MDPRALGLGVLAALVLLARPARASSAARPSSIRPDRYPDAYARAKLATLRARYTGELGRELRKYAPELWRGVPLSALVGLTAMSTGRTEDVREPFRAVGYWNTPWSTWRELARLPRVRELLERPAIVDERWSTPEAVPDQTVIGLMDLRRGLAAYESTARREGLPTPHESTSSLAVGLAALAWSAGPAGAVRDLQAVDAGAVRSIDDARAWDVIVAHAVDLAKRGRASLAHGGTHANAFYGLLRTVQKLSAGAALARAVEPASLPWYPRIARGELASLAEGLTLAAYGLRP